MRIAYNPKSEAPLLSAPTGDYLNAITFDLAGHNIFTRGEMFKGTDTTYEVFKKATSTAEGYNGLVPAPSYNGGSVTRFLKEDGSWAIPTNTYRPVSINDTLILNDTNTKALNLKSSGAIILNPLTDSNSKYTGEIVVSANDATQNESGFMSAADKIKLDNMTFTPGDGFSGTLADAFTTIKVGGKSITAVAGKQIIEFIPETGIELQLDTTNYKMHISGNIMTGATSENNGTLGFVPTPEAGEQIAYLRGDGTWKYITTDQVVELTGYNKYTKLENIEAEDALNIALGKLEYKADLGVTAYDIINAAYDGDGTIENLNELLKVLEGISDTDTIQSILNKYLPLTGGTLTNSAANLLTINRTSGNPLIRFDANGVLKGYIGVLNEVETTPIYIDPSNNMYHLLHSGNYNNFLPKYEGVNMDNSIEFRKTTGTINNQVIDLVTSSNSADFVIYAPNEIGPENYLLQSTGTGFTWLNPASLGGGNPTIEYTKTLTVTQDWMDTGISGSDLETGTYIIQVIDNYSNRNYCSGIMSWYSGNTNDDLSDEILLHCCGYAYQQRIYLRTKQTISNSGGIKLQIAANTNLNAATYTFKFKKMI